MGQQRLVAAALAALCVAIMARVGGADQSDPRLDALFARLQSTRDVREARRLEGDIWRIWIESDDEEISRIMAQGLGALAHRQLDHALQVFDDLVERAPQFAEAWNKRATVHYLLGNFGASVHDIQRTLALEPRHFGAFSGLGLIYDALDEPEAAIRSFEAALAINPHLETTRERIGELRRELEGRRI